MKLIGWTIGLVIFTTVWFVILTKLHKLPDGFSYLGLMLAVLGINALGYVIRKKLK